MNFLTSLHLTSWTERGKKQREGGGEEKKEKKRKRTLRTVGHLSLPDCFGRLTRSGGKKEKPKIKKRGEGRRGEKR